jgi:hypothetical protein
MTVMLLMVLMVAMMTMYLKPTSDFSSSFEFADFEECSESSAFSNAESPFATSHLVWEVSGSSAFKTSSG